MSMDAQKLYDWIREPDWAEHVDLTWLLNWVERRPLSEAFRLTKKEDLDGRP
jgi:hypothetical protein